MLEVEGVMMVDNVVCLVESRVRCISWRSTDLYGMCALMWFYKVECIILDAICLW